MIDADLFDGLDATLAPLGCRSEDGEEFREPLIDILRYDYRPVRLHWLPWLGKAWSVVAVTRQPIDVGLKDGYPGLIERIARAANSRFAPGRAGRWGTIGLTCIVLTPEPITADDDTILQAALAKAPRLGRVVPLGVLRLNLGQEAMAMALTTAPSGLFPEPVALADMLTTKFRRFVSLIDM
jgi:hypothetical protein